MVRHIVPDIVNNQDLLTVPETASVCEATRAMAGRRVRSVLVLDGDGALAGIFTGTDLIRAVSAGMDLDATPVSAAMTRDPETISAKGSALAALKAMHDGRFRHLPVVDDAGALVGILSRRDFLGDEIAEEEHQSRLWEKI